MTQSAPQPRNWKLTAARILVLAGVIGITVFVYLIRDQVQTLQRFGYPGIFVINLLGSATIFLPAPALAIVFAVAGIPAFNPFWLGIAAGLGATLGELSGYGAGFSGQAVVEKTRLYDTLHSLTGRYGMITIFLLAIQPLPLFDLAGVAAGTLRMPIPKFLTATLFGKLIKMWIVAYAGAYSIGWVAQFFK
ncbi:MAG: VTT domain-containing protein [Chloroflexi bacterium]|nr:VTT domain-containing protein [Chloroflexota bacterium]